MADIQEYSVSIKFETKGTDKAAKDTEKINDSLGKLKTSAKGFDAVKSGFGKFGSAASKATKILGGVAIAASAGIVKLGKSAFNFSQQTADYIETVNLFTESMGSAAKAATEFRDKAESALGLDPSAIMDSLASFQNLSEGFGIASDRAYIMSQNMTQLAGDLSSFANISFTDAQKKLMSGFSGQVMPLRKYGIALDQASLQETAYSLGIDKKVKAMTRAQKTELIYYQIMKSTQKMQGDLARTLMSPANALRVLKNEFSQLGRAVGSIFIPLVQRIIPIMRAVTKALTQAATAIAHFFGFNIADYTVDLDNVGDGLGGIADDVDDVGNAAEGTAKKLNKMLMPFDELNNITSSAGSGSGSGTGGGVGGGSLGIDLPTYDMFEGIDDRLQKFENILEGAKNAAGKFNELLREIDWQQVKETAGVVGSSLAELLNVGLTDIDWYLVGTTFAEGFNTIFETAYSFITTFKWAKLGDDIADTINGLFNNIDWAKVGQTLSEGIQGALKTVYTALEGIDWWNLAEELETFIGNIDWGSIVGKLYRGLGAALGGLATFFGKLIADGIEGAGQYFSDKIDEAGGNIVLGLYKGINDIFINVADWIKEHIFGPFIEGFKNAFGIHGGDSDVMEDEGENLIESLISGIGAGNFEEVWETIKSTILGKITEIKDKGIDIFTGFFKGIVHGVEDTVNNIIDGINKAIDAINLVGGAIGINLETIKHAEFADEFDKKMDKMFKTTDDTMDALDYETKMGLRKVNENIQGPLKTISDDFNTTFGGVEKTVEDNLSDTEKVAGIKASAVQGVISAAFGKAKTDAETDTIAIKNNTESGLQELSNSSVFSKVQQSIRSALDNAQVARNEAQATGSGYSQGLEQSIRAEAIRSSVKGNIRSMFASYNETYYWGTDMASGIKDGLNAKQQEIIQKVREMANSIRSMLHFSRPDEGPLRDYETWMPDMIKGLSDSLVGAMPILDNTVEKVANKIAESLSNIALPDVENSLFVNQNATSVIGNIGSRTTTATKDNVTTNMIKATYEAVSRALTDNAGNNDNRQIVVNVGNKELYRGYGQYQDEQSNMLGVNV